MMDVLGLTCSSHPSYLSSFTRISKYRSSSLTEVAVFTRVPGLSPHCPITSSFLMYHLQKHSLSLKLVLIPSAIPLHSLLIYSPLPKPSYSTLLETLLCYEV